MCSSDLSRWQQRSDQTYRNPNLVTDPADPDTATVREPAILTAGRDVILPGDRPPLRSGRHVPGHEPPER